MAFKITSDDKAGAVAAITAVLGAAYGNKLPVLGASKLAESVTGVVLIALGIYLDGALLGPAITGLGIGMLLGAWL